MKTLTHYSDRLAKTVRCKDSASLAKQMPEHKKPSLFEDEQERSEAERLIDRLFLRLKQAFPASSAMFRDPLVEQETKRQWLIVLSENGVTSREQIAAGIKKAFTMNSPYWPSIGQFMAWCREGELQECGLPSVDELEREVDRYNAEKHFLSYPTQHNWPSAAVYWMVIDISARQSREMWSRAELKRECEKELKKMAKRILAGEQIPEPRVAIATKPEYRPAERESVLKYIENMKQMLKGRRTA